MSSEELLSVDYEVFGRVQGVFFRKYTQVIISDRGEEGLAVTRSPSLNIKPECIDRYNCAS